MIGRLHIALPVLSCVVALAGASIASAAETSPAKSNAQVQPVKKKVATSTEGAKVVIEKASADAADAKITKISGPDTRANLGKGYTPAKVGMLLNAGDNLVAGPDSMIEIYYIEENCTAVVLPETHERVKEHASCKELAAPPPTNVAPLFLATVATGIAICIWQCPDDDDPVSPN